MRGGREGGRETSWEAGDPILQEREVSQTLEGVPGALRGSRAPPPPGPCPRLSCSESDVMLSLTTLMNWVWVAWMVGAGCSLPSGGAGTRWRGQW